MQTDINGWGICAMKIFVEQFSIICWCKMFLWRVGHYIGPLHSYLSYLPLITFPHKVGTPTMLTCYSHYAAECHGIKALHLGPSFHLGVMAYYNNIILHFANAKLGFIYNEIDLFSLRNTSTLVGRNFMSW